MNINVKTYVFKVVIEDDTFEDGRPAFHAYCPALQQHGAATWGETQAEALRNIQEVVEMVVEELLEEGVPLPTNQSPEVQPTSQGFTLGYFMLPRWGKEFWLFR